MIRYITLLLIFFSTSQVYAKQVWFNKIYLGADYSFLRSPAELKGVNNTLGSVGRMNNITFNGGLRLHKNLAIEINRDSFNTKYSPMINGVDSNISRNVRFLSTNLDLLGYLQIPKIISQRLEIVAGIGVGKLKYSNVDGFSSVSGIESYHKTTITYRAIGGLQWAVLDKAAIRLLFTHYGASLPGMEGKKLQTVRLGFGYYF